MYGCMYVCNGFLSIYKVYQGWGLKRSSPTDPPKQNGHKFVPTAPIGSKFRLGNTRLFSFHFCVRCSTQPNDDGDDKDGGDDDDDDYECECGWSLVNWFYVGTCLD